MSLCCGVLRLHFCSQLAVTIAHLIIKSKLLVIATFCCHRALQACVPKPVLSNYPVSQDNMGSDAVPRICNASWMDSGLYRMDAAHDTWPK